MLMNRSRNSYIRSPRSVTVTPIGIFSRSRKPAIDFFALVTTGCCPVTVATSRTAASSVLVSRTASPMPMLTTTLCSRGTCMTFPYSNSRLRAGNTSLVNRSRSRAATIPPPLRQFAADLAEASLRPVVQEAESYPRRLATFVADQREICEPDRDFDIDDSRLPRSRARLYVLFQNVHVGNGGALLVRQQLADLAPLPPFPPLADLNEVIALDSEHLDDLRCQRDDFHVVLLAQLSGHGPEDAGPFGIQLVG